MGLDNLIVTSTIISLIGTQAALLSPVPQKHILANHEMNLSDRQPDKWVNGIFEDNILLNLAYLRGIVKSKDEINWDEVRHPFTFEFKLNPGDSFAFQDSILPEYSNRVVRTTNAHFNFAEGFKSDGYLVGDGVCHLASLMYWVARDGGLETLAPTNHDFMPIPGISKEYGVAIYNNPYTKGSNAEQNLYITNNKDKAVTFKFEYHNEILKFTISE